MGASRLLLNPLALGRGYNFYYCYCYFFYFLFFGFSFSSWMRMGRTLACIIMDKFNLFKYVIFCGMEFLNFFEEGRPFWSKSRFFMLIV